MNDFQTRFKPYADAYRIDPEPYQIHDGSGKVLGWLAYAVVWERNSRGDIAHKIHDPEAKPPKPLTYETETLARDASAWLGLRWLEQGAHSIPDPEHASP